MLFCADSNNSDGYNTNDVQAAIDNYVFVQAFLVAYPEYVGRQTWLAGESYGGVYVPTLASKILSNAGTQIYKQLAGISVGNGVFSCGSGSNNTIQIDLFYYHGLVSYENYHLWNINGCITNGGSNYCNNLANTIFTQVGVIDQELVDHTSAFEL
jgi:carboxypeptidase C (cathepsin A)